MAGLREEEVLKELLQLLQDFDGEFERMYRLLEKILYLLDCPELQETETHQKEYFRFLQELCRIKAVSGQYALDTKELLQRLERVQASVPADSDDQPDDGILVRNRGCSLTVSFSVRNPRYCLTVSFSARSPEFRLTGKRDGGRNRRGNRFCRDGRAAKVRRRRLVSAIAAVPGSRLTQCSVRTAVPG